MEVANGSTADEIQTLYIKNMVCTRCIEAVREILTAQAVTVRQIRLGEAEVTNLTAEKRSIIESRLATKGFALIQQPQQRLTEKVKTALIHYLASIENESNPEKLSTYLARALCMSYSHLSETFAHCYGQTIEQFFIRLKIERIKELLSYQELTLTQIADKLGYSSVQALSNQFKKVTGLTVSEYKAQFLPARIGWDRL
jgi:AraC-like DNA-binding protein